MFVAVSFSSNKALYSYDGIEWNETTMPASRTWACIAYGNGKFVAFATDSDQVAVSTDGIVWTEYTLPLSLHWSSAVYGDRFVAIADCDSTITPTNVGLYSEDGITWTQMTMPSARMWSQVSYVLGTGYVAVGYDSPNNSGHIAFSTDGIVWAEAQTTEGIYWGRVSALNFSFIVTSVNYSNSALYSTNGTTWTEMVMPGTSQWSIAYGNRKYLAVPWGSSGKGASSVDGATWTECDVPVWLSPRTVYGNGKFVAISYNSRKIAYLKDVPTTSTVQNVYTEPLSCPNTVYGNGKFVTTGRLSDESGAVLYSTDTTLWTKTEISIQPFSTRFLNDRFIVFEFDSNQAVYSWDGINWIQMTLPIKGYWHDAAYGNGTSIVVGVNSDKIIYSNNNIDWEVANIPNGNWTGAAYGNGKFVTVGTSGIAAYSSDGITWTQIALPLGSNAAKVEYGNGRFVAISTAKVAYSYNGINWTQLTGPYISPYTLMYGNNKFVAAGNGGGAWSNEGVHWTEFDLLSSFGDRGAFGNGKFVGVHDTIASIIKFDSVSNDVVTVQGDIIHDVQLDGTSINVSSSFRVPHNSTISIDSEGALIRVNKYTHDTTMFELQQIEFIDYDDSALPMQTISWTQPARVNELDFEEGLFDRFKGLEYYDTVRIDNFIDGKFEVDTTELPAGLYAYRPQRLTYSKLSGTTRIYMHYTGSISPQTAYGNVSEG
jgi:hypothetical protein